MPLSLTYTEGVLSAEKAGEAGKKITEAFLKWHGLSGNAVMTPNVTMQILPLPLSGSLSGGEPFSGVWIECKVPSFALADRTIQEGFFNEVTDILEESVEGAVPRNRIFSNTVHTVDGTWNMDGRPLTNADMQAALASA